MRKTDLIDMEVSLGYAGTMLFSLFWLIDWLIDWYIEVFLIQVFSILVNIDLGRHDNQRLLEEISSDVKT